MTREEAIRILEEERDVYIPKWIKHIKLDFPDRRWVNALELAIKALEQEPCEDAISRHDVECIVEELENICHNAPQEVLELLAKLKNSPSVIPQPKTGHWIKQTLSVKPFGEDTVLCNQCAFMTDKDNMYNYCPNCGAKMESEDGYE